MPKLYELLGTKKVKEQQARVQQLLDLAQLPIMSVLVVLDPRSQRIDIRAAGVENASVDDIKFVLRQAIDNLTAQAVQAQQEQQQPENLGPLPDQAIQAQRSVPDPENTLANDVDTPGDQDPPEVRQHAEEYEKPRHLPKPEDEEPEIDHNPT